MAQELKNEGTDGPAMAGPLERRVGRLVDEDKERAMSVEQRIEDSKPREYRLCRKADGRTVLQGGYGWSEMDDDLQENFGVEWRDLETAIEPFSITREVMAPTALLLLARQLADIHIGDNDECGAIGREVLSSIDALLTPNA